MKLAFRVESKLLDRIRADLRRPHPFAHERVGFISAKAGALPADGVTILAVDYHPVADDHYLNDPRVGAMMGSAAISKALEIAYGAKASMFHVHLHEHTGTPRFSSTDTRESDPRFFQGRAKDAARCPRLEPRSRHWSLLAAGDPTTR
jgi:hypothetical protein